MQLLIQNKSCQTKAILGIENGKCCIFVSAFVDISDMEAVNLGRPARPGNFGAEKDALKAQELDIGRKV